MRKLASIRQINQLLPIEGADKIELAIVDGWQVIVKKGEFAVHDSCVFFEIDSFLPIDDKYSFLKQTTFQGKPGHRIKTMKMRKTLSQGLALPLNLYSGLEYDYSLGDDVTAALNVIKYDVALVSPGSQNGPKANSFPSFIPKTDQERIQNLTSYFDTHKNTVFEESLKLDGSSMTCYCVSTTPSLWDYIKSAFGVPFKNYRFGVCSRNQELAPSDSNFWKAVKKYDIEASLPCGYALQGELLATNIQGNHEKVQEVEFYVFDIYNIQEGRYLTSSERLHMMAESLPNVPHTPVIDTHATPFAKHTLESLLKHVEGQSMNNGTISEGRVYKAVNNPELTFKVISNKYLLKEK